MKKGANESEGEKRGRGESCNTGEAGQILVAVRTGIFAERGGEGKSLTHPKGKKTKGTLCDRFTSREGEASKEIAGEEKSMGSSDSP